MGGRLGRRVESTLHGRDSEFSQGNGDDAMVKRRSHTRKDSLASQIASPSRLSSEVYIAPTRIIRTHSLIMAYDGAETCTNITILLVDRTLTTSIYAMNLPADTRCS